MIFFYVPLQSRTPWHHQWAGLPTADYWNTWIAASWRPTQTCSDNRLAGSGDWRRHTSLISDSGLNHFWINLKSNLCHKGTTHSFPSYWLFGSWLVEAGHVTVQRRSRLNSQDTCVLLAVWKKLTWRALKAWKWSQDVWTAPWWLIALTPPPPC